MTPTNTEDLTPYLRRRIVERALERRGYTTKELISLVDVTRRTMNRILNELSCICPVQKTAGLWYIHYQKDEKP